MVFPVHLNNTTEHEILHVLTEVRQLIDKKIARDHAWH